MAVVQSRTGGEVIYSISGRHVNPACGRIDVRDDGSLSPEIRLER